MRDSEIELLLAECVEEYHQRRAMGEAVSAEEWKERLGDHFEEFQQIILTASSFDDIVNPVQSEKLPRDWGQYTLLRILGRGSMGNVYEAMDNKLRRTVALKVLRHGYDHDPVAVERFRREARACAQIQHDHVIAILEFGVHEGTPFYAMPIVSGQNLQTLIKEGRTPSYEELCRGLAGIADALSVLHERGIIHRDVKPGNIMVDENGRMLLSDFGLARTAATESLTQTGQALGTPLYMSPEQILGQHREVDGRTDVYGLGVSLYEALAGRPPFRPKDSAALMRMIVSEQPPALKSIAPDTPADLSRIAMAAMEKEKEDRYGSAAAMRDDLLAWVEGERVVGRPVSAVRRGWRRSRRAILLAASVVLALAILWQLVPPRDGMLVVESFPIAAVSVDGVFVDHTKVEEPFPPGEYEVKLSRDGCHDVTVSVTIKSGDRYVLREKLLVAKGQEERFVGEFAEELDITLLTADLQRMRSGDGPPVQVLYPRGAVRIADLTEAVVELNSFDVEDGLRGVVRLMRGEELLWSSEPDYGEFVSTFEIGPAVRGRLSVGDEITLGFYPERGTPTVVEIRIVADPLAERIAAIDKKLGKQNPLLIEHLKAQALFNAELYTAAYLAARKITEADKGSARGWYLQKKALERLGIQSGTRSTEAMKTFDRLDPAKKKLVVPEGN